MDEFEEKYNKISRWLDIHQGCDPNDWDSEQDPCESCPIGKKFCLMDGGGSFDVVGSICGVLNLLINCEEREN